MRWASHAGNTDQAGVCRSSEVTAQVIKDAALYAIFPGLVSFLQSVGVWSHSWFRARIVWVCVGCSCILVWILSSSGLFNQQDLEYPSINTFLSPEKLMAAKRSGVVERVESTAITVSFCGWLNYNLWFINSSWCCQRRGGKEVSLWQHWNLEERYVTNLRLPSKQLHFLKSQINWSIRILIRALCCSMWLTESQYYYTWELALSPLSEIEQTDKSINCLVQKEKKGKGTSQFRKAQAN